MSDLQFVAFSDDGKVIILQTPNGEWIEVPIAGDHAAAAHARVEQPAVEIGELTPREIQARIRAGATPEQLAAQSGAALERIMMFAPPILLERKHVAERASQSVVRRATGSGVLADVVKARLEPLGVDVLALSWDSLRREDGRWTVILAYPTAEGPRVATWLFDVRNAALVPADDEARWLVGDPLARGEVVEPANPTTIAPKLSIVRPTSELPIQPAADPSAGSADDLFVAASTDAADELPAPLPDYELEFADAPAGDEPQPESDFADDVEPPVSRTGRLPSWDEILFGKQPDQ